ncbi:MAG: hypothetical protein H8D72_01930 [Planctomycetes bacterium]|nr:hypothetical protein [Planctomycetota bacterium]
MKFPISLLTIGALALALGACSTESTPAENGGAAADVEIPTQADADSAAAKAITEANAEESLADLEKEISGDL